jgi:hypothetical protein
MIIISYWRMWLTCLLRTLAATAFPWQEEPRAASGGSIAAAPAYQPPPTTLAWSVSAVGRALTAKPGTPGSITSATGTHWLLEDLASDPDDLVGVAMRQAVSEPSQRTRARAARIMNSDGQRHPWLNAAALFTFFAGIAAFAIGFVVRAHLAATILGAVVFGIGMYVQLISATREQRVLIVTGMVGAFVGLGLGIAHGGFG